MSKTRTRTSRTKEKRVPMPPPYPHLPARLAPTAMNQQLAPARLVFFRIVCRARVRCGGGHTAAPSRHVVDAVPCHGRAIVACINCTAGRLAALLRKSPPSLFLLLGSTSNPEPSPFSRCPFRSVLVGVGIGWQVCRDCQLTLAPVLCTTRYIRTRTLLATATARIVSIARPGGRCD